MVAVDPSTPFAAPVDPPADQVTIVSPPDAWEYPASTAPDPALDVAPPVDDVDTEAEEQDEGPDDIEPEDTRPQFEKDGHAVAPTENIVNSQPTNESAPEPDLPDLGESIATGQLADRFP